jgi:hypothetical protein
MGVQTYLLNRRTVILLVGGLRQEIGTLRRFWKVTEIDHARAEQIEAAKVNIVGTVAPLAVMTADAVDFPLATSPDVMAQAHVVLGWDADRYSVTDFGWDYLPVLGYSVRNSNTGDFTLYEELDGILYPVAKSRAIELGITNKAGQLIRHGQPLIAECQAVKPFITSYVEAECVLNDGRTVKLLSSIEPGELPAPAWYVGKRPSDIRSYPGRE